MKIFVALSVLVVIMNMFFGMSYKYLVVLEIILLFGIFAALYKNIDWECLYKMAIRYFYDEGVLFNLYKSKQIRWNRSND